MTTLTVRFGDTLSRIAQQHRTSVATLARLNGLSNRNRLAVGQSLQLPDSFGTTAAAQPASAAAGQPVRTATSPAPTSPAQPGTDLTVDQLTKMMPSLSANRAAQLLPHLNAAMREAGISSGPRAAAFIAQLGHESGSLEYMEELASGAAYEGRRDLGNTQRGDGVRFKGRGPIQVTGRANYAAASRALGVDLVGNPALAATPEVAFRVAAWFWNSRDLNTLADQGRFDAITRRINGGVNGKADRDRRHTIAKRAYGL